jgi:ribosomal protein L27
MRERGDRARLPVALPETQTAPTKRGGCKDRTRDVRRLRGAGQLVVRTRGERFAAGTLLAGGEDA